MLLGIIFIGLIFIPAVIAAGYDVIDKHHTEADVQSVWVLAIIINAVIPLTVYLMFFC